MILSSLYDPRLTNLKRYVVGVLGPMKKLTLTTLMLPAIALSACDDDKLSCSNSAVVQRAIEHSRELLIVQSTREGNPDFDYISQGEKRLQDVTTESKTSNSVTCSGKLYIKLDPKIIASPHVDLKADPILNIRYSAQETADHKEYYVSVLTLK